MGDFRAGQISPAQGLVLGIVFPKGECRDGLAHFVAQIESVAGVDGFTLQQLQKHY